MTPRTAFVSLALASLLASCVSSPGGPDLFELGVFEDRDGALTSVACVTLPVLQGSRVDERRTVEGDLDVAIEATRSGATVRFLDGEREVDSTFFSDDDLSHDLSRGMEVTSSEGTTSLRFTSHCSGSGGAGGSGGSGGSRNTGGSRATGGSVGSTGGATGPLGVSSATPLDGPYGTTVTIAGQNFGSKASSNVTVSLGDDAPLQLTPASSVVTSWAPTAIVFRFPFPREGSIVVSDGTDTASAGKFAPSYAPGEKATAPASAAGITSISDAPGRIVTVIDTTPPTLFATDGKTWSRQALPLSAVRNDTIRLYLATGGSGPGELRGYALSTAEPPEIVALTRSADGETFESTNTGVFVTTTFALAAGTSGAAIWYASGDSWTRVRPTATTWAVDKGPVQDPNPSATLHSVVATSDGGLHVVWAEATGSLLDDTGTPFVQSLASASSTFGTPEPAGGSVDDYVSTLVSESRGDGFLLRYCGSNVDPFGFSGSEYRCRIALHSPDGTHLDGSWKDDSTSRHAVTGDGIAGLRCDDDRGSEASDDLRAADAGAAGEIAVWPCAPVVAAELDAAGKLQFIVRSGSSLYSPRPR